MNFLDWYNVEKNSEILVLEKEEKDINKYKNHKYDYIYLNGTLEHAKQIMNTSNYIEDFFVFLKSVLKPNGNIFIATDNRIGVKYMVGNKCQYCNSIYDSIKNNFIDGKLYSKSELDKIIEKTGFAYKKYYYPLPNYENPNVIYTDKYLPNNNESKINYNFIYNEESLIVQDEINLLKVFIEENKFKEFTNSYIIQLSNTDITDDVKFYSFTPIRKDKYSLMLRMRENFLEKIPLNKSANNHIEQINKNTKLLKKLGFEIAEIEQDNIVMSKFIKHEQLDKIIVNKILDNSIEEALNIIDEWFLFIKSKLNPNEQGIVKHGFIDMVFENTFYDIYNKKFIMFDQEWYEENIPLNYIMYRAINNLYEHNSRIDNNLPKNMIFEKYKINIKDFEQREKDFQNTVIDSKKLEYYSKQYKYKITSEELKNIIKAVSKLDKDNIELINGNNKLNRDNIELINENKRLLENNKQLKKELDRLKK